MKKYIAICDQSLESREYYGRLCQDIARRHHEEVEVTLYSTEEQILFALEENCEKCNVIFIDINNCGACGVETTAKIKEKYHDKEVVFLTCSKNEFREGFDLSVLNYIVKNEDSPLRFEQVLIKALEIIENQDTEYLLLSCAGEYRNIAINSIYYFEVIKRRITVHYDGEKTFEFVSTMDKVEKYLQSKGFLRVHRGFLVAASKILRMDGYARKITLKNGTVLPIGSVRYKYIKQLVAI